MSPLKSFPDQPRPRLQPVAHHHSYGSFVRRDKMSKKATTPKPMSPEAASRIQSHADRTGRNQDFKSRAQSSAAKSQAAPTKGTAGKKQQ